MPAAAARATRLVAPTTNAVLTNTPHAVQTTNAAGTPIQCAVMATVVLLRISIAAVHQDVVPIHIQSAVTENTVASSEALVALLVAAVTMGRDRSAIIRIMSILSCSSLWLVNRRLMNFQS